MTVDGLLPGTGPVPEAGVGAHTGAGPGDVDFALVAYREEGFWQVQEVPAERADDIVVLADELRRWPGESGCLGLVSVDEDFFVVVRVTGADVRVLLSDVTAATDWPLARSALELLGLPVPGDDDEPVPGGDPGIVADLGLPARDMGALLDDPDSFPDETLGEIADRLGFGALFDEVVGVPETVAP